MLLNLSTSNQYKLIQMKSIARRHFMKYDQINIIFKSCVVSWGIIYFVHRANVLFIHQKPKDL